MLLDLRFRADGCTWGLGLWGWRGIAGWTNWGKTFGANIRIPARLNENGFLGTKPPGEVFRILNSFLREFFRSASSLDMSHFFQLDLLNSLSKGL